MNVLRKSVRLFLLFYFLSAVQSPAGYAQPSVDTILHRFQAFSQEHLQEKLFVHVDKNFYLAGELLWFKIYNVDASSHLPLSLSKVAYVEMIDMNNQPVLQLKVSLDEGTGDGFLYLPLQLNSGSYKLRAYTSWMKNYSADFFFEKTVAIINTNKTGLPAARDTVVKYDIQFFPEGGNLVNGIESKIAFRVSDQYGTGMNFTGSVVDENNDTVARFKPLKFGIGSFYFTPAKNHVYRTVVQLPGERPHVNNLVPAHDLGYVMAIRTRNDEQVEVTIRCNVPSEPHLYLITHTRQSVKAAMMSPLRNGQASFVIDKQKLGEGISHFTLFSAKLQPVCERLYFRHPDNPLAMQVKSDKDIYNTREKVNVEISAGGMLGKPQPASLSMAVYKVDSVQKVDEADITTYLLLTSELKGHIESADYYLKPQTSEGKEACDNLMLTHGWRRFLWKDIMENKQVTADYAPEYKGHIITAKIIDKKTSGAGKSVDAYLSVPEAGFRFYSSASGEQGHLKFDADKFYGSSTLILQPNAGKDSLYQVEIEDPFSTTYTTTSLRPTGISVKDQEILTEHHVSVQVQHVYARNPLSRLTSVAVDTIPFYLKPDFAYNLNDYTRFTTMEEVIREYVKYVFLRRRDGVLQLRVFDLPGNRTFEMEPLVLLDGVPVFDVNQLMNIDPAKIRKLETVNSKYFYGPSVFSGILNLTSYEGDFAGYELNPGAVKINYEGLQLKREFYSPTYDTEEKLSGTVPDFRNLLYWSPALKTRAGEISQQSFYTSDRPGKYVIVVQGISNDGNSGSAMGYFEVKK